MIRFVNTHNNLFYFIIYIHWCEHMHSQNLDDNDATIECALHILSWHHFRCILRTINCILLQCDWTIEFITIERRQRMINEIKLQFNSISSKDKKKMTIDFTIILLFLSLQPLSSGKFRWKKKEALNIAAGRCCNRKKKQHIRWNFSIDSFKRLECWQNNASHGIIV